MFGLTLSLLAVLALRPIRRKALQMETNRAISEYNNKHSISDRDLKASQDSISAAENEIGTLSDGGAAENKLAKWNVLALEAGIVFHSVIIGVTIGTASGEGWVPLLIVSLSVVTIESEEIGRDRPWLAR